MQRTQGKLAAFVANDDEQNRPVSVGTIEGCVDTVLCVCIICDSTQCLKPLYSPNNKEAEKVSA